MPFYYLNLFNVPRFAKPEDIITAFESLVTNVFPAGTSNRCWDLEFKDKLSLFKALQFKEFKVCDMVVCIRSSIKNRQNIPKNGRVYSRKDNLLNQF